MRAREHGAKPGPEATRVISTIPPVHDRQKGFRNGQSLSRTFHEQHRLLHRDGLPRGFVLYIGYH
jgi:hypothetical protein